MSLQCIGGFNWDQTDKYYIKEHRNQLKCFWLKMTEILTQTGLRKFSIGTLNWKILGLNWFPALFDS